MLFPQLWGHGAVFHGTRSRESEDIDSPLPKGQVSSAFLTQPTFLVVRFRHIYFKLSLYLREMCPIARREERGRGNGGKGRDVGHRSEWSPIIERRSHGFYAPVYSLFQRALSRTSTVGCQTWHTTAVISAPPSVGHAGNVFASSHLTYRSNRRRCYSVLRCPIFDPAIYRIFYVKLFLAQTHFL